MDLQYRHGSGLSSAQLLVLSLSSQPSPPADPWSTLNPEQRQAVEHGLDDPQAPGLLVIAGAVLWLPLSFAAATGLHVTLLAKAAFLPAWMQLLHLLATIIAKSKLLILPVYPAAWPQAKKQRRPEPSLEPSPPGSPTPRRWR